MADTSKYQWTVGDTVIKYGDSVRNITLDASVLNRITKEMKPKAAAIVKKYGTIIASSAVKRAPVDTGALINSILASSKMVEDMTFRVQDGVTYGIFQELGTSKMAARPFLVPSVEEWRSKFLSSFSELFK